MDNLFERMADATKAANRLYTEVMPLAAIWLDKKVKANDVLTYRITDGDLVTVKDGKLVNEGENTHVITACRGTLNSNFAISVIELGTLELSEIKL